jgi:hypothetical protein
MLDSRAESRGRSWLSLWPSLRADPRRKIVSVVDHLEARAAAIRELIEDADKRLATIKGAREKSALHGRKVRALRELGDVMQALDSERALARMNEITAWAKRPPE